MPISVTQFSASKKIGTPNTQITLSWSGSGASSWQIWFDGALAAQGSGNSGSVEVSLTAPPSGWGMTYYRTFLAELRVVSGQEEVRKFLEVYCVRDNDSYYSAVPSRIYSGTTPFVFMVGWDGRNHITRAIYAKLRGSSPTPPPLSQLDSQSNWILIGYNDGNYLPFAQSATYWAKTQSGEPRFITTNTLLWDCIHEVTYFDANGQLQTMYANTGGFFMQLVVDPPQASLSASVTAGPAGYVTLISWETEGASQVRIRFNGGPWQTLDWRGAFTYEVHQTTLVELEASNMQGTTSRQLTLTAVFPPSISASVSPGFLNGPGVATLSWNVANATSVLLNGEPVSASGSRQIVIESRSQQGEHHFDFVAVNQYQQIQLTGQQRVTLVSQWPPRLTIDTVELPDAETTRFYSFQLAGSGGFGTSQDYVWSIVSGHLPPGLSMSSSGLISGTPVNPETGVYAFRVRLSDNGPETDEKDFSLRSVRIDPVRILAPASLEVKQRQPVLLLLQASDGYGNYEWSVSGLPSGLVFEVTGPDEARIIGQLSGTANADHAILVTVSSRSADGQVLLEDSATIVLRYRFAPVSIVTQSLPDARGEEVWHAVVEAVDGEPPYQWSWSGLPTWASAAVVDGRLELSGSPSADDEGQYFLQVSVSDAVSWLDSASYAFRVRRAWSRMDPFHTVFFRVYDSSGQLIPGFTNDPYPDDPKTAVARLVVGFTVGVDDIRVEDVRRRGGGLLPEFHGIPEADHFWDVGFLDGRPWPVASLALVLLPAWVKEMLPSDRIRQVVDGCMPMGAVPVLRFYGSGSGWSPGADF